MKLSIKISELFVCLLIFIPIFIGIDGFRINFDILGKFDVRISRGADILVFPLNLIILCFIFIFSKPFKLENKLILLNIVLLFPLLISLYIRETIEFRLFKQFIGLAIFFNSYYIFNRFHKTICNNIEFHNYIKLLFYIISVILLINLLSFFLGNQTAFLLRNFQIYSFYDYYPLIFLPMLIFSLKYFFDDYNFYLVIFYFFTTLLVLYLSQSRTIQLSFIVVIFLSSITFLSKTLRNNVFQNISKFYILMGIIFFLYFFLICSFFIINTHLATGNTLAYRMIEVLEFIKLININNFLLPQLTGNVTESFHNQFIEIYNWYGVFSIYILYHFKIIIDNSFKKNPTHTFNYTIYVFLISLLLLPITHLYTSIILSFYFSLLSYKSLKPLSK